MLKLVCVYIKVSDMTKSIKFYSELLECNPSYQNDNRWANFELPGGYNLALYNINYDITKINSGCDTKDSYNDNYISCIKESENCKGNGVILNFQIDNLNLEYERIKKIKFAKVSKIMYVNIAVPYSFFHDEDLDGNI